MSDVLGIGTSEPTLKTSNVAKATLLNNDFSGFEGWLHKFKG